MSRRVRVGNDVLDKALDEIHAGQITILNRQLLVFGALDLTLAAAAAYLWPFGSSAAADSTERGAPVPHAGRLENLQLAVTGAGTGAADVTYTVRVNGKDTPLQLVVENREAGTFAARSDRSVLVKAGDRVSLSVKKSTSVAASPTNVCALFDLVVQ